MKKITITSLILVLLGIGFFAISTHAQQTQTNSGGDLTTSNPDDSGDQSFVSQQFIVALQGYKSLRLSTAVEFFKREDFASLKDFSQEIPLYPIGRPNPFAPIDNVSITGNDKGTQNLGFTSVSPTTTTETKK